MFTMPRQTYLRTGNEVPYRGTMRYSSHCQQNKCQVTPRVELGAQCQFNDSQTVDRHNTANSDWPTLNCSPTATPNTLIVNSQLCERTHTRPCGVLTNTLRKQTSYHANLLLVILLKIIMVADPVALFLFRWHMLIMYFCSDIR